jgi:hypothetical protein
MPTSVFLLLAHTWHWGCHLSLAMPKITNEWKAQVLLPAACQMVKQVYIDHTPCGWFRKKALAVMPTTVLLLLASSWQWGHHLSLVMKKIMSEEAHIWLPALCLMVKQVYFLSYSMSSIHKMALATMPTTFFLLLSVRLTLRQSYVIGDVKNRNEWRSTCMAISIMSNGKAGQYWW